MDMVNIEKQRPGETPGPTLSCYFLIFQFVAL
ncbi:Hypothetical protein, conserved [Brucella abortus str. 2308 A]|uniref:Uncharacterized protein n=7 Tax=Brucella TaxID=234 RepID=C0RGK1_BRUMB|nr:hypothetical protein BR0145 [Brucella suis 1330]ABQ61361.1 conserved hypothetical protein [Brucella ovis ATCC 25840]ABX61250.1 Hypothetical protein, conserved [Brucella canis ATCC 23365]ABY37250.1 Hypothetical protein, conserved [Brucella suis ATCC 23445]ACN99958.1 Hypothetical protein, conserved [Brucella melitensis ATCC 23457]ACU47166.1 hypothetical protein BMI_I148 [Brucella microti CCM 4915]ADZ86093.1 conserved hypothetical protein [Brucella melitensis M5-90]AEK53465.1 hypothetical pr